MSVYTKPNPIAIDAPIQKLQIALDGKCGADVNFNKDRNIYGRIYRNNTITGKYQPQAYKGNREYTNSIFFEDTVTYQTFFDIGETIKVNPKNGTSSAKVYLYFFGDLAKIYGNNNQRNDEECINFITDFVNNKFGFYVKSVDRGIKKILSDYAGAARDKAMIYDLQPRFCFRIEMELPHYPICFNVPYLVVTSNAFIPFVKNNPVGVDYWIDRVQNDLFNYVLRALSIDFKQYNCYPRIYRNLRSPKEYLPEGYVRREKASKDYTTPILFNDNFSIQSFFDIGESNKVEQVGVSSANVQLYFFADLNKIYNTNGANNIGNTYRWDMEIIETVCQFVNNKYGFMVLKKTIGIKEVMKDFTGAIKNQILMKNMQPFYCFRLDMVRSNYNTAFTLCPAKDDAVREYEFDPNQFNSNQFQ